MSAAHQQQMNRIFGGLSTMSLESIDRDITTIKESDADDENSITTSHYSQRTTTVRASNSTIVVDDDDDDNNDNNDTDDNDMTTKIMFPWYRSPKFFVGLLLGAIIGFIIVDTFTTGYIRVGVEAFLEWIQENPVAGCFLFVLVYFVATVLLIPGSILTLGAGFVFSVAFGLGPGVALGSVSVFCGASFGAIASFVLARYLLRDAVGKLSQKYTIFQALDQALKRNGLKIFVLLRLSPIVPFNIINYLGGVSAVSMRDYILALFAIIPGTILYVFLGASAGSLADSAMSGNDPTITIIVVVVGAFFGILAIGLTTRYARRELNRVLTQREGQEGSPQEEQEDNDSDDDDTESGTIGGVARDIESQDQLQA